MASVHKDKRSGTWYIRWREGKSNRAVRGISSKAEAESQARRIERELSTREPLAPGQYISPADSVDHYLATRLSTTEAHRIRLAGAVRRLIRMREWTSWDKITPATVQGMNPHQARCLRAVLRWAHENGQHIHPRVIVASRPKNIRKPQAPLPDPKAVSEAIARADEWHLADGTIAHLIATYGHRAQSVVGIRVKDWEQNENGAFLTLPVKSGDIHRHPLIEETVRRFTILSKGKSLDEYLLVGHLGCAWTSGPKYTTWWSHHIAGTKQDQAVKERARRKRHGEKVEEVARTPSGMGILDLRRLAITNLLGLGLDGKTVASITGHRTVSLILNTYARTTEERQRTAISALARSQNVLKMQREEDDKSLS